MAKQLILCGNPMGRLEALVAFKAGTLHIIASFETHCYAVVATLLHTEKLYGGHNLKIKCIY